ncbi:MAG: MerR family transcriptional regulator, partial [Edaphobacter sp.]
GIEEAAPATSSKQLRKLQKELRDILAILSKPATRAAVHPIRAPRHSGNARPAAPKLFDLSQGSEDTKG